MAEVDQLPVGSLMWCEYWLEVISSMDGDIPGRDLIYDGLLGCESEAEATAFLQSILPLCENSQGDAAIPHASGDAGTSNDYFWEYFTDEDDGEDYTELESNVGGDSTVQESDYGRDSMELESNDVVIQLFK